MNDTIFLLIIGNLCLIFILIVGFMKTKDERECVKEEKDESNL